MSPRLSSLLWIFAATLTACTESEDTSASTDASESVSAECLSLDWAIDTFEDQCCTAAQRADADADAVCSKAEARLASDLCLDVDHVVDNYDECCTGDAYETEGHGATCTRAEEILPPANDTEYRYAFHQKGTQNVIKIETNSDLLVYKKTGSTYTQYEAIEFVPDGDYYNWISFAGDTAICSFGERSCDVDSSKNSESFCVKKKDTKEFVLKVDTGKTDPECLEVASAELYSHDIKHYSCSGNADQTFKIARVRLSNGVWVFDRWQNGESTGGCN